MNGIIFATLCALVGVIIGAALTFLVGRGVLARATQAEETEHGPPEGIEEVLEVLPSAGIVIAPNGEVINASAPAYGLGLVDGPGLSAPVLQAAVGRVRSRGIFEDFTFDIQLDSSRFSRRFLRGRAAPLGHGFVLVVCDDETESHRVEAVRRDFVANVSHELKTPIGAISLLAETITDYSDDPEAVHRFGGKIQKESARLEHLVEEIIDLSRVQDNEQLAEAPVVALEDVVEEAVDQARTNAEAKNISINVRCAPGLEVAGSHELLVKTVRNLVDNAVNYSNAYTSVGVATERRGGRVAVIVKDRGIGMSEEECNRIFERFYRVDPARSRLTGGTGLGLSIVKHVVATHRGKIQVWSREGEGSTFTVLLPMVVDESLEEAVREEKGQ